ncbi:MAG: histidine--tRNA ligase [Gammaproteobacteria bacterium]|nr:histidine--tRNA ligase [Gammaproteobacteria bacterium]
MRDLLPTEASHMTLVEETFKSTLASYGYDEIRLPTMEWTVLFQRGVGEDTDAVGKEMYTFEDSSGESISLRPEGTASCVRAAISNTMLRGDRPRLWYTGNMFRHEQPQKGRYREFMQFGAEVFGYTGPDIDVELIQICEDVWRKLGISDRIDLQINTLGNLESRLAFRNALVDFLVPLKGTLDPDSVRRLDTNPLRILDSKSEETQNLLQNAPRLTDYLDEPSTKYFEELRRILSEAGVSYSVKERMVRGLDYYSHAVFEWHSDDLGAQSQVGGGGRYDGLVERLGGSACPASGFAVGIDRIALVRDAAGKSADHRSCDVYVISLDSSGDTYVNKISRILREQADLRVRKHHGGGRVKNRFRDADRSGALWALVVGEEEMAAQTITLKPLRTDEPQITIATEAMIDFFNDKLKKDLAN